MSILTRIRRAMRASQGDDSGFALISVLGMGTVMTLVLSAGFAYTLQSQKTSNTDRYAQEAYNAAVAGINDYVARLNKNPAYCSTTDSTNNAFTQWVPVGGNSGSYYRYDVVSDCSASTTSITLRSSGFAGPTTKNTTTGARNDSPRVRTITTTLSRAAFTDYVFFTDKEQADPTLAEYARNGNSGNFTAAQMNACKVYSYTAGSGPLATSGSPVPNRNSLSQCTDLSFLSVDTLNGKVHSNDLIKTSGTPTFKAAVSTGCPSILSTDPCKNKTYWTTSGTPSFQSGVPSGNTILGFPADNSRTRTGALAVNGGYICQGPTRIVFQSDGTMAITSPKSTGLGTCPTGVSVAKPASGVVYVNNIASTSSSYTASCPTSAWVTSPVASGNANTGGTTYPVVGDNTVSNGWENCNNGNVWVEGNVAGQWTIGAENNIYITGDIIYKNGLAKGHPDILGLTAQNSIAFYHPMKDNCSSSSSACVYPYSSGNPSTQSELCTGSCTDNLRIDAAMLSITHSIYLPFFDNAGTTDKGTLTINGNVAELYRGPVKSGSAGYAKQYNYDSQLQNVQPPWFPEITTTLYTAKGFTATTPMYCPDYNSGTGRKATLGCS